LLVSQAQLQLQLDRLALRSSLALLLSRFGADT
jgi:hypothetical protein